MREIDGQIDMNGSKVAGTLNMDAVSVSDSLFMGEGTEFRDVVLSGAHVGGRIEMTGVKVNRTLNMDAASVSRDLYMREGAKFKEVILRGAQIGGQLDMQAPRSMVR